MSITILGLAKSFVGKRLSANEFANPYMELWKFERDYGLLKEDEDNLSECLSTIFCMADLYNPENDREDYEFDEDHLRIKVADIIKKFNL